MTREVFKADFPTETIKEGAVKVLVPQLKAFTKVPSDYAPSKAPVFYNPVMELNRDLAVLALQAYQRMVDHRITVCEPLTACGLRGIRYAAEVKGVEKVVVNDISKRAFGLASLNVKMNGLAGRVAVRNKEANSLLSSYSAPRKRFDIIDIDPFGSPVHFLDSAIRALRNDGLLALTATDMAPLCGVHPKACIRKYGGRPLRTEYCHELAVRLLAGCLATTAAKYEIGVKPVFSHWTEHYVRMYATIKYGAKNADESIKNMGYILHCFECFHREGIRGLFGVHRLEKCSECGSRLTIGGPMWVGNLFNAELCKLMEEEVEQRPFRLSDRIKRILALTRTESDALVSYYVIDKLCDALSLPVPPAKRVVEALRKEGFQAYRTHFNYKGIRSDAPASKISAILHKLTNRRSNGSV